MTARAPAIEYRLHGNFEGARGRQGAPAVRHAFDVAAVLALRAKVGMGLRSTLEVERQLAGARWVATAHDGDRLVGFARAISDEVTNGYISTVMVDPDYQRRGIGREIIRRIIDGKDHIRWVLHARREAMAFYRAIGFDDAPDMMWRDRR